MNITRQQIESLGITPSQCIDWVRRDFLMKNDTQLPPKMSVHPSGSDFITTMPCLLPGDIGRFGVKVVSRLAGNTPALKSDILLYDSITGDMLAVMDGSLITTMRTAAVAVLAIETLRNSHARIYAFTGLGNTGRSTLYSLLERLGNKSDITIRLFNYKDHADRTIAAMSPMFPSVKFETCDTMESLVDDADVVVSCITSADGMLVDSPDRFKPGVLLVPVHTRGFQNCDTVFDRIIGDDTGHLQGFQYFDSFREFHELTDVLRGDAPGRLSDSERIIAYNIGLGLHDIYFASKIYDIIAR